MKKKKKKKSYVTYSSKAFHYGLFLEENFRIPTS